MNKSIFIIIFKVIVYIEGNSVLSSFPNNILHDKNHPNDIKEGENDDGDDDKDDDDDDDDDDSDDDDNNDDNDDNNDDDNDDGR